MGALSLRTAALGLLMVVAACSRPPEPPRTIPGDPSIFPPMQRPALLGLRTVIYQVPDVERAKAWYSRALDIPPYFDEPSYVGFNVGGFELGLRPGPRGTSGRQGVVAYWGVENADVALARLLELGARENEPVQDVGGGVRVATVRDPFGNVLGIIESPPVRAAPAR